MRKLLIAGNWKMYLTFEEALTLASSIAEYSRGIDSVDVAIFPSAVYLNSISDNLKQSNIYVGVQNLHPEEEGAFTGEISAKMVLTSGGNMVILGHSERRHIFGESNEFICAKVKRALYSGLTPVLCIGEKLGQRDAGQTEDVLDSQLSGSLEGAALTAPNDLILAYEPVWAIGTGRNATPEQAQEAQAFVRDWLSTRCGDMAEKMRILYGGSVKPNNAVSLLSQPDVDGALVGGASLKKESFCEIIKVAVKITEEGK